MSDGSETPSRPPSASSESGSGNINVNNINEVRLQLLAHLSCNGNRGAEIRHQIKLSNGKTIHITREYGIKGTDGIPYDPKDDVGLERLNRYINKLLVTGDGFEILGESGEEEVVICVDTKSYTIPNPIRPRSVTRKKILSGKFPTDKK